MSISRTQILQREVDKKNSRPYLIRLWKKYEIAADGPLEYAMLNLFPPLYGIFCFVAIVGMAMFMFTDFYG